MRAQVLQPMTKTVHQSVHFLFVGALYGALTEIQAP